MSSPSPTATNGTTDNDDRKGRLVPVGDEWEPSTLLSGLYGAGMISCQNAYSRPFAAELKEDIESAFAAAKASPNGVLPRGAQRYYCEIAPSQIRGFNELVKHPWFQKVNECVLGKDWKVVEVGFDIPFPGSEDQPWHRDFPAPPPSTQTNGHSLTTLAFNLTTIDVTPDMGPLHFAPGTQWDDLDQDDPEERMFPKKENWRRYEERAVYKMPKMGDISARSALTIHRGTANKSQHSRPMLVIGCAAPNEEYTRVRHDVQVLQSYLDSLDECVRSHLNYRLVDKITPIEQKHTIDGLLVAADDAGNSGMGGGGRMGGMH